MSGATAGVQRKIQDEYPNAHYTHWYARQLNLTMQKATSYISKVRFCFPTLMDLPAFFPDHPSGQVFLINYWPTDINTVFEDREDIHSLFWEHTRLRWLWPQYRQRSRSSLYATGSSRVLSAAFSTHHATCELPLYQAPEEEDSIHFSGCIQQFQQDIQKMGEDLYSCFWYDSLSFTFSLLLLCFSFLYYYTFSLSFTEILSIPWLSKAVALNQKRDVSHSVQETTKWLQQRWVHVVEISHSLCYTRV